MYEIYREKLIVGNLNFDNSDIMVFLKTNLNKVKKVANFTSQTKKKIGSCL